MTIPKELEGILVSTPDTLGGSVRFSDTRVPVACLLDNLSVGNPLDEFLKGFPNVSRYQAQRVMQWEQNLAYQQLGIARENDENSY